MTENINSLEIVKDIVENHFAYMKQELPELKSLVNKLLRVHYDDCKEELVKVYRAYGKVENKLEVGMIIKQIDLFPSLWDYFKKDDKEVLSHIKSLILEINEDNMLVLKAFQILQEETNDYTMPEDGCQTYESTYKRMKDLHKRVIESIEKEESIYKQFI